MLIALLLASVVPVHYDLTLAPHQGWFSGAESIELELDKPSREVRLDSVGLEITRASASVPISIRRESDALILAGRFPAGRVTIELEWRGQMSADHYGIYQQGDGVFTQLEPDHARRVFPCIDRPGLRARFTVHALVDGDRQAISNGAVVSEEPLKDARRVDFAETPPIPSYLVALAVGRFDVAEEKNVRVLVPRGNRAVAESALRVAVDVIDRLEKYLGVPFPFAKLDVVAAPELPVLAMENAGAIFVRAEDLLGDDRARVRRLAHEIAHQWFGDLVTMASWRDLWLSEALARFTEFAIVDDVKPEWNMWREFQRLRNHALAIDSRHPIRAQRPSFDEITYDKGAAAIWMLESWMGESAFRDALHEYLIAHSLGVARAEDLFAAMAAHSSPEVFELGRIWFDRVGHPTLEVKSSCKSGALEVQLNQRARSPWPLPVRLQTANTTLHLLLRGQHQSLLLREPEGCPARVTADGDQPYLVRYSVTK